MQNHRKLRVFLCHASNDKPIVRDLYNKLAAESWIGPWLDEEQLLHSPAQTIDNVGEKKADVIMTSAFLFISLTFLVLLQRHRLPTF